MATRNYQWRTAPAGVTEGDTTVYVDSSTGSDLKGLGTREKPYQSLAKAWRLHKVGGVGANKKPAIIICRGVFSEELQDGNHTTFINGDYFGAATFNGKNQYVLYAFKHSKLMIINTMNDGTNLFAGVGAAAIAYSVGNAYNVGGVAGASVLLDNTALYWGVITVGGTAATPNFNCWSRPKISSYKISLGLGYQTTIMPNNTIYGCDISNRAYRVTTTAAKFSLSIFAAFDMYADEPCQFTNCLFAADVNWYYTEAGVLVQVLVDKNETSATIVLTLDEINKTMTVGGGAGAAKVVDIPTAIAGLVAGGKITSQNRPVFTTCKFSKQISTQIFNNPEKQDFTLKINGDGLITSAAYYGAFPPSLNVPILDFSEGIPGTWDETTAAGKIYVDEDCIKMDESSLAKSGSIESKVIQIDTSRYNLAAIYSAFISNFKDNGSAMWEPTNRGTEYAAAEELPIGRYAVNGTVTYDGILRQKSVGDIVVVETTGTTFTTIDGSTLIQLIDSNISDVVYVRTTPAVYVNIKQGDGLQEGATYINCGEENIIYQERTVGIKESFVAKNSVDDFIHADAEYRIGAVFQDTRIPLTIRQKALWIPAQLFGEYFVVKNRTGVKIDDNGIPVSSGNYLSWAGYPDGYVDFTRKAIKERYIQFKFIIKSIYDNPD